MVSENACGLDTNLMPFERKHGALSSRQRGRHIKYSLSLIKLLSPCLSLVDIDIKTREKGGCPASVHAQG